MMQFNSTDHPSNGHVSMIADALRMEHDNEDKAEVESSVVSGIGPHRVLYKE